MARVVVTKAERVPGQDAVTVSGTVDGAPVQVNVWFSQLQSLVTKAAQINYVAQVLKAAAQPTPTTIDLSATVDIP